MKPRKENRTFLCAAILLPFFMMSSGLFSISPPDRGLPKTSGGEEGSANTFDLPSAWVDEEIVTRVGEPAEFRGQGFSPDAEIVKYEWDFDGDGVYDWESTSTGKTSHVYSKPGQYNALFRVSDSRGRFRVEPVRVVVEPEMRQQRILPPKPTTLPGEVLVSGLRGIERDGVVNRYAVMINSGSESRFWDDVVFMYSTLINDYGFTPDKILLYNWLGTNPDGENPDNMIDGTAYKSSIDNGFNQLAAVMDEDDRLLVWVTGHGQGYQGVPDTQYYGYLASPASVDPGDEEDYLESEFKLRSLYVSGRYWGNHGMNVWKVYYNTGGFPGGVYEMSRRKYVSSFTDVYFEQIGTTASNNDVFIERFNDLLAGDTNRDGVLDPRLGEVSDFDGDGVPPYDHATGAFDGDDWGSIDSYENFTRLSQMVPPPGHDYMIFDAGFDNHLDIDLDYDSSDPYNLEVHGTDIDNQGLFDGLDVNQDGDMDDWVSIDETIDVPGPDLIDDELAEFIARVTPAETVVVLLPCYSGGFIEDLSRMSRVICSATQEETVSYNNYFIENFSSALHWRTPEGLPVDADADHNGHISMVEGFNFASDNDPSSEIPQYDDNGDGMGHAAPIPNGGDGTFGAGVYLTVLCHDLDEDGYGDPASSACTHPEQDCDDGNPNVNPGHAEVPGNGLDDDCDGAVDESCFVATAAFGSELEPRIEVLRAFRDRYLATNPLGRAFVRAYYEYGRLVADSIAGRPWLKALVRTGLLPVIGLVALFV